MAQGTSDQKVLMMKYAFYLCIFIHAMASPQTVLSQDEPNVAIAQFTTESAKIAFSTFSDSARTAAEAMAKEVQELKKTLRQELHESLKAAAASGNLDEVKRITDFLQVDDSVIQPQDQKDEAAFDDMQEVRNRLEKEVKDAKHKAVSTLERVAKDEAARGDLNRAAIAWKEVLIVDPTHKGAKAFFALMKSKKISYDLNDRRNVWLRNDNPKSGFIKTSEGWFFLNDGKPGGSLKEIARTEFLIQLQTGNDIYHLHQDALYGKGVSVPKWHLHGFGKWVR